MGYFLGIDIGTFESKGCIVDENFKILKTAKKSHSLRTPKPGWAEHDANEIWWNDFVRLSRELLSDIDAKKIIAVGCSAIAPTMLPVDKNGEPLRPAILYGIDTRASSEIEDLEKMLGKKWIRERCWNDLSSQSVGPKILWFKRNEPHLFEKTWKIMTATSFIVYKLTKQVVIDFYTAAAFTPLFNLNTLKWQEELSEVLVPPEKLPFPMWTASIAGTVTKEAYLETGIPVGTPVIVGTADAAAEFVSAGGSAPGDFMIMIGTTIFFIGMLSNPPKSEKLWNSVFLEPNSYCLAGGMATGGALTKWFRDNFAEREIAEAERQNLDAYEILYKESSRIPPGSQGLLVLPYFSGERTPLNDPKARGVIAGLTISHGKYHIYRALLEGVAFGIRHNFEEMEKERLNISRVIAVGGGTKNPLWLDIISSVIDRELLVPKVTIGASFGDTLLAAISQKVFRKLRDISRIFNDYKIIQPDNYLHQVYNKYYEIYRNIWNSIRNWVHKLADFGRE